MVVRTQLIRRIALLAATALMTLGVFASARAAGTALPNGWRLTPAGATLPLGTLPLHIAQDLTGHWLAISNAGFGDLSITIVNEQTGQIADGASLPRTFYGLAFSPTGDTLYASTAADGGVAHYGFDSSTGKLGAPGFYGLGAGRIWTNGLAVSPDGGTLYAAVAGANDLVGVNTATGATQWAARVGDTPYAVALSASGAKAFVSNWGGASVSVVDTATGVVTTTVSTDGHPGALLLSGDGHTLFIACANANVVDVLDATTFKMRGKIDVGLYPSSPAGSTPSGIAETQDGRTLLVADADSNAVAVIDISSTAPAIFGAVPVGWYPTDVALSKDGRRLYVLDGNGVTRAANPSFINTDIVPRSQQKASDLSYYAPAMMFGDLETIVALDRRTLVSGLAAARANSDYRPDLPAPAPLPPFKHVIYVIKENRTYDQVLGDDPRGNGQASLAVFGQRITPTCAGSPTNSCCSTISTATAR